MLVHLFSRIISSWFVFALPLFRSFQALQRRSFSEIDVEHYAKYWIVIATVMAFEYSIESLVSWFPFYWELKFLLLLFLSLPQTRGSTYVYDTWLAPFLARNETYIDRQIHLAETNFLGFFQSQLQSILEKLGGGPAKAGADGNTRTPSAIQNALQAAVGYLTAHGTSDSMAGKSDVSRPNGSRTPSGASHKASASSTAVDHDGATNRVSGVFAAMEHASEE